MSSVITDIVDCPQCGLPCQKDEYYVVGEERVVCNWCGYTHTKSHTGLSASNGYGSIHYVPKDSNNSEQIIRFKIPLSLQDRHKFITELEGEYDTTNSSFYAWNEEKNVLECLVGKKPKTLDEIYDEQAQEAEMQRLAEFGCYPFDECDYRY